VVWTSIAGCGYFPFGEGEEVDAGVQVGCGWCDGVGLC
jgi:hypothetical protein